MDEIPPFEIFCDRVDDDPRVPELRRLLSESGNSCLGRSLVPQSLDLRVDLYLDRFSIPDSPVYRMSGGPRISLRYFCEKIKPDNVSERNTWHAGDVILTVNKSLPTGSRVLFEILARAREIDERLHKIAEYLIDSIGRVELNWRGVWQIGADKELNLDLHSTLVVYKGAITARDTRLRRSSTRQPNQVKRRRVTSSDGGLFRKR